MNKQKAFTIIECLISLSVGLAIMMLVQRFWLTIHHHFLSLNQDVNQIETFQRSYHFFNQSISQSRYLGCFDVLDKKNLFHTLPEHHPISQLLTHQQLLAIDNESERPVLWTIYAKASSALKVEGHPRPDSPIHVAGYIQLKPYKLAIVSNCQQASVFMVSGINHTQQLIEHQFIFSTDAIARFYTGLNNLTASLHYNYEPTHEVAFVYELVIEKFYLNNGVNGQGIFLNGHELIEKIHSWDLKPVYQNCFGQKIIKAIGINLIQEDEKQINLGVMGPRLGC